MSVACFLAIGGSAHADVAVNNDGSAPDGLAIFDVKANNGSHFIINKVDGRVGISTLEVSSGLHLDVEGKIGAQNYCDETGLLCGTIEDLLSGGGGGGDSVWGEANGDAYRLLGSVGIGTSTPTQKLDVDGYVRGTQGLCIGSDCRDAWPDTTGTDDDWGIANGNVYRLVGNVGIGTDTPEADLHVAGTGLFDKLKLADVEGDNISWELVEDGSNNLVGSYGGEIFRFDQLGNMGLGISPSARLHLGGVSRPSLAFTRNDTNLTTWSLVTGSNDYFYLKPALPSVDSGDDDAVLAVAPVSGNVGVGTITPGYKLDIAGSINFTGGIFQDGVPFTAAATNIDALTDGVSDGSSVFLGENAGKQEAEQDLITDTTSNNNVGVGVNALRENTIGTNNVAVGKDALQANLDGQNNIAIGASAMLVSESGSHNTAIGVNALSDNTSGSGNMALGILALSHNRSGDNNIGVGGLTLDANVAGSRNVAIGYGAASSNGANELIATYDNIVIGFNALAGNVSGSGNTVVGAGAAKSSAYTHLEHNAILGFEAGTNLLGDSNSGGSGSDNVLVGYRAGSTLGTGAGNIIIGAGQQAPAPESWERLNIGGVIFGDLATGEVGIGEINPQAALHVTGKIISDSTLSEDSGGTVTTKDYVDGLFGGASADDQTLSLPPGSTVLSIERGNSVDLEQINTDEQGLSLSGTDLSITGGTGVDLSVLLDGTGTDNQTLTLTNSRLFISGGNDVDLSPIDHDEQDLSLVGTTLSITGGDSVNLQDLADGDDQTLAEVLAEGADANGVQITNLGNPDAAGDATNKAYVDARVLGARLSLLDVDQDGYVRAEQDATLILKYLFGIRGATLIESAVSPFAQLNSAAEIEAAIGDLVSNGLLDIDGDGSIKPLTDGLLVQRWVNGVRGIALTNSAIDTGATRTNSEAVSNYMVNTFAVVQESPLYTQAGNVGIGTTSPGEKLQVNGNIYTLNGSVGSTDSGVVHIANPAGAAYNGSGTVTGAIKITLPNMGPSTMMKMTVEVYDYTTDESFTVKLGGYNYSTTNWTNTFAQIIASKADRDFTVRFGDDGSKGAIWIGETNSTWSYPKVRVIDFVGAHSNATFDKWDDGWDVTFVTSFGTIKRTATSNLIAANPGASGLWTESGSHVYRSSGNVGIGTTGPSQKLDVAGNVTADRYYDRNNTNYYIDPASTSYVQDLRASIIYDRDDTGYYMNGNSTSRMYRIDANDLRADIFYDRNNTGYYVNPASTSNLNAANFAGTVAANNGISIDGNTVIDNGGGWHRSYGATGWYNGTYGGGVYMSDSTWVRTYGNKGFYHNTGIMRTDGTFQVGNGGGRFIVNTSGNVGIGDTTPDSKLDVNGTIRAPQICDENGANCKDISAGWSSGDQWDEGTVSGPPADWYNASWQYRKQITINSSMTSATQSNFPVMIKRSSDSNLASGAQSDADDIVFTSSNGTTKLNHEIDYYNSSTGELVAWVNIPSLPGNANSTIYMYYGNASASNQANDSGAWDSGYKAVYHFKENPSIDTDGHCQDGVNFAICDSTSYNNDLDDDDYSSSDWKLGGPVGRSVWFDGYSNYFEVMSIRTNGLNISSNKVTLEAWVKPDTSHGSDAPFVVKAGYDNDEKYMLGIEGSSDKIDSRVTTTSGHSRHDDSPTYSNNTWVHMTMVYDGSTKRVYKNGVQVASHSHSGNLTTTSNDLKIGKRQGSSRYYKGELDEIRISDVARSASWVQAQYNNMNNHNSYINFSAQTPQPSGGQIDVLFTPTNIGRVGIGTSSPAYTLHVDGTAYATAAAGALSDRRHKNSIFDIDSGLDAILKLRPVSYKWNEVRDKGMEGVQVGFIAQEVENVLPSIVMTEDNLEKTKSLKYQEFIPILTKAIQELKAENDVLKILVCEDRPDEAMCN